MTRRVETKGSFARRQVYTDEGLDETTFLLLVLRLLRPLSAYLAAGLDITSHSVLLFLLGRICFPESKVRRAIALARAATKRATTKKDDGRVINQQLGKKGLLLRDH